MFKIRIAPLAAFALLSSIAWVAVACGNEAKAGSQDLPAWCPGLVESLPFSRDDLGHCYALSGVVTDVDSTIGDGGLTYVKVAAGEPLPATVVMPTECSTWAVGDPFDEKVDIVARVSWPADFRLPYCATKPVPSRNSVPSQVSYEWCDDGGEPLPMPAVRDLIEDPEAQLPVPSEHHLHKCFRIMGEVVKSHYPGYDTTEYVTVKLDQSGSTVMVSGPSVCLSLKDKRRVDVLAFYQLVTPGGQNGGLGLPDFYVPDARYC